MNKTTQPHGKFGIMYRYLTALVLGAILLLSASLATAAPLTQGNAFPDINLEGNLTKEHRKELGLKGNGPQTLSDIKSDYVLIEVFSMYCPFCQAEAPSMNELYGMVRNSPLGKNLAVIGLGAGNSQYEVDFFREKYSVPFALFTDADLKIHKQIGETATPHFYIVDLSGKIPQVVYSQTGRMKSADAMFQMLQDIIAQ
ncbi:peroxiredoxin family protein [Oleidesulfovibrio sp.]|uniref:peroxiredoxin family protein n=1 Tax=Oleidesulfovibrio sp. TaxID=2909707 RepID=UPI003A83F098